MGDSFDDLNEYDEDPGQCQSDLARLPTGRSSIRLARTEIKEAQKVVERLRGTLFNLDTALAMTSNQTKFANKLIEKTSVFTSMKKKLLEMESTLLVAMGGGTKLLPVISNLETVKASNKYGAHHQGECRPQDVRAKRLKRKRVQQKALSLLATVRTPLVEANRPNKKRASEACRHQKNYKVAARKTRVPQAFHSSIMACSDKENN